MTKEWVREILKSRRNDSRQSTLALAKASPLSQSAWYARCRSVEEYITRNTILLDFRKLGLVQYFFIIRPFQHKRKWLYDHLSTHANVNSLFVVAGSDLAGEAVFKDCAQAESFFDSLENGSHAGSVERFLVQQEIGRELFMTEDRHWRMLDGRKA